MIVARPFVLLLLVAAPVAAADQPFSIAAQRFSTRPLVDGSVDDAVWADAARVSGFLQIQPQFGAPSPFPTEVLIGYDDEAAYIAFLCHDAEPGRMSAAVTARDGPVISDDAVAVFIDTLDDDTGAYFFRTNLLGTQADGRIADNGRSIDDRWDESWECAARRTAGGWTVEFAIRLRILRYRAGNGRRWGVNFVRTVPRRLETSAWAGPGESQWKVSAFGVLTGLDLPHSEAKRWDLIPYALGTTTSGDQGVEAGGDVRLRLTSTVAAEATINPDFALIEADVEQINLTRFELFVPEKRPFFLEGAERFNQRIQQFYSRRIGDIPWGVKASGSTAGLDFVAIATAADVGVGEGLTERAGYGILRLARGFSGGSSLGLVATDRRLYGVDAGSVGLDTTLFFSDTLGMTAQAVHVHGPGAGRWAWFVRPAYDSATTHFHVRYTHLDAGIRDDFNAVGFLRDDNRREFDTNLAQRFSFERSPVEEVACEVNYNRYEGQDGVLRSTELDATLRATLRNRFYVQLEGTDEFKRFEKDFDNNLMRLEVGWDNRRGSTFAVFAGEGFNFDRDVELYGAVAEARLSSRWRAAYEYTDVTFTPDPENETTRIHVFRTDYYFTPDLFIKVFFQTNAAIDKENVQTLLVWRFLPPFGALQLAYQTGTSAIGTASAQRDTVFVKLSWVF